MYRVLSHDQRRQVVCDFILEIPFQKFLSLKVISG